MKSNPLKWVLIAMTAFAIVACGKDRDGKEKANDENRSFVPFKTFVEDFGTGKVTVRASFDAKGRSTGFVVSEDSGDASYEITFDLVYGSDNTFTATEKDVASGQDDYIARRYEGTLSNGLMTEARLWEGDEANPVVEKATYDKEGHLSSLVMEFADGGVVTQNFTWADGNLTEFSHAYKDPRLGNVTSVRTTMEYGTLVNKSGLGALMGYPGDFYEYPLGFLLGTAFTKNIPVKRCEYDNTGTLLYGVEYVNIKTNSEGLVTGYTRKGLNEYSGDDFTYTLTY